MMMDARRGHISVIIVKDFSRFGRDHLEVGNFLERILTVRQIRFICVNDNFDSEQCLGMSVALKNILNAMYSRDLSVKVKTAMYTRAARGEYVSAFVAYGYRKNPENIHQLVVDPEAVAELDKMIPDLEQQIKEAKENAKEGTNFGETSGVNEEWLERFMDSAGFVSSEDMQLIWGKILANEFEEPGTTPPNMIRVLSEITPVLARAFRKICSMRVWICPLLEDENIEMAFQKTFVPYNGHEDAFREMGISFNILNELETLGVIKVSPIGGYVSKKIDNAKVLLCIGDKLEVVNEHKKSEIKQNPEIPRKTGHFRAKRSKRLQ